MLKILIFAWRFLANQIPTCDNLFKKDVKYTYLVVVLPKHLSHIFFLFVTHHMKIWCDVFFWLTLQSFSRIKVFSHVQQINELQVCFLKIQNCSQCYLIDNNLSDLKSSNPCFLNNKVFDVDFIITQIKLEVLWWFKVVLMLLYLTLFNSSIVHALWQFDE